MHTSHPAPRFARTIHRGAAWLFDRSGPFAPALARVGSVVYDRIVSRSRLRVVRNPVQLDGLRINHPGRPSYHLWMFAMGMHDRDVVRLLHECVKPGMTVLDVGAHIGYISLLSARLVGPGGSVWAFEPSPESVGLLRRNIQENGFSHLIQVVPQAVSNTVGPGLLFVHLEESMLSSLVRPAPAAPDAASRGRTNTPTSRADAIEVRCTTLDAWAAERHWPRVDLIKLDVEGFETAALEGMTELSRRNAHLRLIVELNVTTLSAAGSTVEAFWRSLQRCGFVRISMAGRGLRPIEFPADRPRILQTIRRMGNDRVNLLCERILV